MTLLLQTAYALRTVLTQVCTNNKPPTTALYGGAFCQFPFRWIYYCHSYKSIGKKTGTSVQCNVEIDYNLNNLIPVKCSLVMIAGLKTTSQVKILILKVILRIWPVLVHISVIHFFQRPI